MPKTERVDEFDNFDRTMRELVKVPHKEIKAKIDAEKREKKAKKPKKSANDKTTT